MISTLSRYCVSLCFLLFCYLVPRAQFLMDMTDTTGKLAVSGYMQPQFQAIQEKGASSYNGGDFSEHSNNRFMLRRGRVKVSYSLLDKNKRPAVEFAFQYDGTERGVNIRDFWGRMYENRWNMFSVATGMFARPFGYEINLSSQYRETPERGRMSQILMRSERDIGAMISFEPRNKVHPLRYFTLSAGLFNGQGLSGRMDFDSYKDFITRFYMKPRPLGSRFLISGGLSHLNGGIVQNSRYIYRMGMSGNQKSFLADSSQSNIGRKAPRRYYGADAQFKWKHGQGFTELRGEYWQGTQTALSGTSETPGELPSEPYYIRSFNGAFFYLLHSFNPHHMLGVKYDLYDPNTKVTGDEVGMNGINLNETDIRYNTLGFGYTYTLNQNLKWILWYEIVTNETTWLTGFENDLRDNLFTARIQYTF
jgi:hypothetical protein